MTMTTTSERLKEMRKRAAAVQSLFVARERKLFTHGIPDHPWEKHRQILGELRAERNRELLAIEQEAYEYATNARETIADCQNFDRSEVLSSSERREGAA